LYIAIIIGRKNSKGFSGKNLYPVLGRPLSYYPMKAAKDCPKVDKFYVSTDDDGLMELAGKNDIEVIVRPAELCTDAALGEDVFVHAYNTVKEDNKGQDIEIVVLLMCNAATINSKVISKGIKILEENPEIDSAVSVSKYNMWSPLRAREIDEDGLLVPFVPFESFADPKTLNCDRDSQGDAWFADMGVSIVRPRCLENVVDGLLPQKWMGKKIYPLKQWGGCDIDYEWQIPQVEFWLKKHGFAENETNENTKG
jgi:hypothetical protein